MADKRNKGQPSNLTAPHESEQHRPMALVALTIAGSDSTGGAGIQAGIKTFAAFGVFGTSALTALTAQNTCGVSAAVNLESRFVAAQIDAVTEDLPVVAAKTGMLSRREIIEAVAERISVRHLPNVVVDPVMVAASGAVLLEQDAISTLRRLMMPLARVTTPNLREAELLTGRAVSNLPEMREAARAIAAFGTCAVLVKGGWLTGEAIDVLYDGREIHEFRAERVAGKRAHGAGCTLSAAIAACLARGFSTIDAVDAAKGYVTRALETAPRLGHGAQPLNHLVQAPIAARDDA
jgi:hydroxymethylpyrimidine/phosphomethylpyrimidine kinase